MGKQLTLEEVIKICENEQTEKKRTGLIKDEKKNKEHSSQKNI